MRHLAPVFALTCTAALAMTSCADRPDAAPPNVSSSAQLMDAHQRQAEYTAFVADYRWPLPNGAVFPKTLPPPTQPTMYEVGEGRNQADTYWICAWMGQWLRTRNTDSAAATVAWRWVEKSDQTQLHTLHYYDPNHVWDDQIVGPAAHGHPKEFEAFYNTSCDTHTLPPVPRDTGGGLGAK